MTGPRRTFPHACVLVAAAALAGACAAGGPETAAVDDGPRLLLRVADRAADGAAVARLASTAAGAPVEHLSASGGGWHAVRLRCAGAACDAALARLRESTRRAGPIEAVEPDGRRHPA